MMFWEFNQDFSGKDEELVLEAQYKIQENSCLSSTLATDTDTVGCVVKDSAWGSKLKPLNSMLTWTSTLHPLLD